MPPRCLPPGPLPPTMVPPPLDAPRRVTHQLPAGCSPCRAAQHAARRIALAAQWRPPRCRQRHAQQATATCPRRPRWIAARRAEQLGHRSAHTLVAAPPASRRACSPPRVASLSPRGSVAEGGLNQYCLAIVLISSAKSGEMVIFPHNQNCNCANSII
jgi:hypothetical protein